MITTILFDLDGTLLPMDQEVFVKDYLGRMAAFLAPHGYDAQSLIKAVWAGTGAMVKNEGKAKNEDVFWQVFNSVIGKEIVTPDGTVILPVSRVSFAFGSGGGDYGKTGQSFGGGSGAGVKIDPVAFLVIKDGVTRVMPVAVPPVSTVDRVIDLVPEVMDRVENYLDKKKGTETL